MFHATISKITVHSLNRLQGETQLSIFKLAESVKFDLSVFWQNSNG